jgi:GR25 family glycosyltransferase involved in LPS biosynthesis
MAHSIVSKHCSFNCLSFRAPDRSAKMKARFDAIGLELQIHEGVDHSDPRIADHGLNPAVARMWSATYGHLDMIQAFLRTNKRYGVFCENDVNIHKNLVAELPAVMEAVDCTNTYVMLLGYMITTKIGSWMNGYSLLHAGASRTYLSYPPEQWGVHMYMLSREGAAHVIDLFAKGYAVLTLSTPNSAFSPDWTISKIEKRALVYPMLAVEDGEDGMEHYQHEGQYAFHRDTHNANYIPGMFL